MPKTPEAGDLDSSLSTDTDMTCKAAKRMAADASEDQQVSRAEGLVAPVEGYFRDMPPEFIRSADVELCVSGKRLPAHSQFLASQSRFMAKMNI